MDGMLNIMEWFYFLVLRMLLLIGCVESNPGPMVKGINYKQNIHEEDTLRQLSLEKLQEENQKLQEKFQKVQKEIQKLQEDNNKLKEQITLMKSNVPNQETTGRWNYMQDRKIPGLDREIASALKNGEWMKCIEIIRENIPADDTVYKQIWIIDSYECLPLAAAEQGYVELIHVLLYNGLNVNERMGQNEQTMLHIAAQYGKNNVVELLLNTGADIEVRENYGSTPLHKAASNGHDSIVQMLLEKGADIIARDINGSTPLHTAAWNAHPRIVQILIEKGAYINSSNNNGWTPLHYAAYKGHVSVVECLLINNCNREIKTSRGKTALDYAREKGYCNIVRLLDK